MSVADLDTLRVLVLGDPGVGKSSLLNMLCERTVSFPVRNPNDPYHYSTSTCTSNSTPTCSSSSSSHSPLSSSASSTSNWATQSGGRTVGCGTYVRIACDTFEGENRTTEPFFVEFVEVGGGVKHSPSRHMLYQQPFGAIILVHDLSNAKSLTNLMAWARDCLGSVQALETLGPRECGDAGFDGGVGGEDAGGDASASGDTGEIARLARRDLAEIRARILHTVARSAASLRDYLGGAELPPIAVIGTKSDVKRGAPRGGDLPGLTDEAPVSASLVASAADLPDTEFQAFIVALDTFLSAAHSLRYSTRQLKLDRRVGVAQGSAGNRGRYPAGGVSPLMGGVRPRTSGFADIFGTQTGEDLI